MVPLTSLAVLSALLIAALPPLDIALRLARAIWRLVARLLFVAVATCDMMYLAVNAYSLIVSTDRCQLPSLPARAFVDYEAHALALGVVVVADQADVVVRVATTAGFELFHHAYRI
jgi:hypothetical protein